MSTTFNLIHPDWSAPANIRAASTTRAGGQSLPPYAGLNLGLHVADNAEHVLANRQQLQKQLGFTRDPFWLNQTHSTTCVLAEETISRDADAAITRTPHLPLAIMTADCLPILLCDQAGKEIAAIHAGWRGLAHGIIEQTVAQMQTPATQLLAWLGPAICGQCYEVGQDVYQPFSQRYAFSEQGFTPRQEKWLANVPVLAQLILQSLGIQEIYYTQHCTFEKEELFYSYRRDGQTGRMATFIWIEENA
jgi:polyphenol oxidase